MPTLDAKEKAQIQKTLGQMASPLYTTLAKLYVCSAAESEWRDTGIWGAVSVVFDRTPPASRHIKLFDMQSYQVKFSQELHEYMSYTAASEQFHTFEAQSCIVGLSFTDVSEAHEFMAKVISMIPTTSTSTTDSTTSQAVKERKKSGFFSTMKSIFGKNDAPVEIGRPTDFVHKQHIGYDPQTGFQSTDIPSEWASIFKNAGIRRSDLQNPEVAAVIYSTLQSQFGGEATQSLFQNLSIQTTPQQLQPSQSSLSSISGQPRSPISPTVPKRPSASSMSHLKNGAQPSSPKPMTENNGVPGEHRGSGSNPPSVPTAFPAATSAPPPVPPAMLTQSAAVVPIVPPPAPASGADVPSAPSMDAPEAPPMVSDSAPPPPPFVAQASLPPPPPVTNNVTKKEIPKAELTMDDHLKAIRGGISLKKVAKPDTENALPDVSQLNKEEATTLTAVLQNAMRARLQNIQAVDEDDDDDGWD